MRKSCTLKAKVANLCAHPNPKKRWHLGSHYSDSEIVMVDRTFWDDSFEQDQSWNDSGTTM